MKAACCSSASRRAHSGRTRRGSSAPSSSHGSGSGACAEPRSPSRTFPTPRSTWTRPITTWRSRAPSRISSPRRVATGSSWSWRTNTWGSSRKTFATRWAPTRGRGRLHLLTGRCLGARTALRPRPLRLRPLASHHVPGRMPAALMRSGGGAPSSSPYLATRWKTSSRAVSSSAPERYYPRSERTAHVGVPSSVPPSDPASDHSSVHHRSTPSLANRQVRARDGASAGRSDSLHRACKHARHPLKDSAGCSFYHGERSAHPTPPGAS